MKLKNLIKEKNSYLCVGLDPNPTKMGYDSLKPFLKYQNKTTIILSLTSNEGAGDFQMTEMSNGNLLFEDVIKCSQAWERRGNIMYVVGGTYSEQLSYVKNIAKNDFLLVPGVGAQGGTLKEVSEKLLTDECGLLVNMSRSILYSDNPGNESRKIHQQMEIYLTSVYA